MQKLPIDADYLKTTLLELLAIPSPTGLTDEIVHYTGAKLNALGVSYELTRRGTIRAILRRTMPERRRYNPACAIVAHLDTLGAMVREIKSSPMLFGYRGSEVVDITAVERLILRVAQLQHDLPQVSSLDLSLVLAGADGVKVLTAGARVDPVLDPRSDWFVRRLPRSPGDTLPN